MIIMEPEDLLDQAGMERAFRRYFQKVRLDYPKTMNDMLEAQLLNCDYDRHVLRLEAEAKPWMANPGNILHGGITASYLDLAMGLICRYCTGGRMTRTVHVDVNYLRAVPLEAQLCIEATATKLGTAICFASGSMWEKDCPDRLLAAAVGSYAVAK